ncbi:MAG: transglutaminase-like domain-containing protein [Alphaproteobacteria bacterium]|nr:transglutaminase-like domain-containing protein [Alphaproteobacteria bacterium]
MKLKILLLTVLLVSGCSAASTTAKSPALAPNSSGTALDNTPVFHLATFNQEKAIGNELVLIDLSNISKGYFGVKYGGSNNKPKLQLTLPSGPIYTYNLTGATDIFNLVETSGVYEITVYENIEANRYGKIFKTSFAVEQDNEFDAFLYNNQYVNFDRDTKAVYIANDLVANATSNLEKIRLIFDYIITEYDYDYAKAKTVAYNYIPDLDEIYQTKKGICFDYAALLAAMLRTQDIPTRLEFGYVQENYHAWVSVYTKETGWIDNFIHFENENWQIMDPTFISQDPSNTKIKEFTTVSDNYQLKYIF